MRALNAKIQQHHSHYQGGQISAAPGNQGVREGRYAQKHTGGYPVPTPIRQLSRYRRGNGTSRSQKPEQTDG